MPAPRYRAATASTPAASASAGGFFRVFPGEFGLVAAEVAAGGRLAINRPAQVEILNDAARRQREELAHQFAHPLVVDAPVPSVSTCTLTGSATPMA